MRARSGTSAAPCRPMSMHQRRIPLASLLALLLAAPLAVACTASQQDEGADEGAVSSDSAITDDIAPGSRLVTTTRVNLRETPSQATRDNIITVMPMGTVVTVRSATPTTGFYRVDYEGQEGWAFGTFLAADSGGGGGGGGTSCYDGKLGSKLASVARTVDGDGSQGLCYRYVKNHIEGAGIPIRNYIPDAYEASAYKFAVWAKADPAGLAAAGFAKSTAGLDGLPLGAILVWRAGQCGYSAEHGHIEITIGGGRACSDFCGRIKRDCGMPDVFVPVQRDCK